MEVKQPGKEKQSKSLESKDSYSLEILDLSPNISKTDLVTNTTREFIEEFKKVFKNLKEVKRTLTFIDRAIISTLEYKLKQERLGIIRKTPQKDRTVRNAALCKKLAELQLLEFEYKELYDKFLECNFEGHTSFWDAI